MSLVAVILAILCVLIALGCWLGFLLLQQGGRVLLRLEAVEHQLNQRETPPAALTPVQTPAPTANGGSARQRASLPLGTPAPEWELPDLSGLPTSLSSYRGRQVLVVFFNPKCGFCIRMAPDLAALPVSGTPGAPLPVVVSNGTADENLKMVRKYGFRCPVVLQDEMQLASRYQVNGTPMGYLVDEAGAIASDLAVGAEALLELARPHRELNGAANRDGKHVGRGNRTLADSKMNRGGLSAGTSAPDFRLPRLGGGEISLGDFKGQRVLLVFSDPECGPCDQLSEVLESTQDQHPEVRLLMISRGDEAANRLKAEEHGLTFPIALQQKWEISRRYETFATPVGFLIGADGRTISDAAVGMAPILSLLSGTMGEMDHVPAGTPPGDLVKQVL